MDLIVIPLKRNIVREFGRKAADVGGLYLNPPEDTLMLAVDEKPSIQALERAQGALEVTTGLVKNGAPSVPPSV